MNSSEAKQISIISYLSKEGFSPVQIHGNSAWFLSPLHSEKTASFKVDISSNIWYDHSIGTGGNLLDLIMQFKSISFPDALTYLNSFFFSSAINSICHGPHFSSNAIENKNQIELVSVLPLHNMQLLEYCRLDRNINCTISKQYLQEIHYRIKGRLYYACCFPNLSGGYEIRSKYFKGCYGSKDISVINNEEFSLSIFEGFFDFLSALQLGFISGSVIILNSLSNIKSLYSIIPNFDHVLLYFDNDQAGFKATSHLLQAFPESSIFDRSFLYKPFNDVNEYHCSNSIYLNSISILFYQPKKKTAFIGIFPVGSFI
jgi:hypothetical protein